MSGHRVEASRLVAVAPGLAFERLLAASQEQVFAHRFAAFPAVRQVVDAPEEPWGTVGQSRTIVLADSGRLHQTITAVDPPRGYTYRLDGIQGTLRPFVRSVDGAWTVTPEGEGSRIVWSWTLHPKAHSVASPARLTMTVLGRMWKGYADRALGELERILTRPS